MFVAMVCVLAAAGNCAGQAAQKPASGAVQPGAGAGAASSHVWHMKKETAEDQVDLGNGQPSKIVAYSMLMPTDWTGKLGVYYPQPADCNVTLGQVSFSVQSADQLTGLNVLPIPATAWTDNPRIAQQIQAVNQQMGRLQRCVLDKPIGFENALKAAAGKYGTLVGSVEPIPHLSDQLAATAAQANAQLQQQGQTATKLTAYSGRQRITATMNGKTVEAYVMAIQVMKTEPAMGGGTFYSFQTPLFAVMRAPQGQLDAQFGMILAMLMSIEYNPQWQQVVGQETIKLIQIIQNTKSRLDQIASEMAADNARTAQRIAQIHQDTANYAANVRANVAANRATAMDHSAQQFSLYMGDRTEYSNPATGEHVQLPSQYGHAWASSTGNTNDYIVTDSPSFNPNGNVGNGSWTEMQAVK
jgi:hypothetical protein